MKTIFTFSFLLLSLAAFADQGATLKCQGKNIILEEKSPYLGENSKFSQSLYVLKTSDDESSNTAYFLSVEHDVGRAGKTIISAKNEVGGSFTLETAPLKDESDDVSVKWTTTGVLKYAHGPLKGKETVICVVQ